MCKNRVKWLYRSDANFSWASGYEIEEDRIFFDSSGRVRLIIESGGRITVTRGYSWNGCSPKICVFDIVIGTPDGVVHTGTGRSKTYFATMVHDALYQFLGDDSPLTRRQADEAFLRLMADSDFAPRLPYWGAVRLLGRFVWWAKRSRRQWRGTGLAAQALLAAGSGAPPLADEAK